MVVHDSTHVNVIAYVIYDIWAWYARNAMITLKRSALLTPNSLLRTVSLLFLQINNDMISAQNCYETCNFSVYNICGISPVDCRNRGCSLSLWRGTWYIIQCLAESWFKPLKSSNSNEFTYRQKMHGSNKWIIQVLHTQSDYSDQSVNWILTARSDICSLAVKNLSKWWTVIHGAAWSTCNLLHVRLWRAWPNGLYITCSTRFLSMKLVVKK